MFLASISLSQDDSGAFHPLSDRRYYCKLKREARKNNNVTTEKMVFLLHKVYFNKFNVQY